MPFQISERYRQLRSGSKLKFSYFEKAKKFETIPTFFKVVLSNAKTKREIFYNFFGLFRISKLYLETLHVISFKLLIEFIHTLIRTFPLFDRKLSSVRSH